MANKIGVGLALDGEKEFKDALKNINKDLAVMNSSMRKTTAEYADNANGIEALTAKSNEYQKIADSQKEKVNVLAEALENAKKEYGENSKQVKDWQIKLNSAETQLIKTERNLKSTNEQLAEMENQSKGIKKVKNSMDNLKKGVDDLHDKAKPLINTFKNVASAAGKIGKVSFAAIGVGAVAAGAAAVKLGKEVISAYADFEQLVGGVDTLFGEASQTAQNYAANAFKTAGMSANEYMETVTGFSASLIQSLGGDTTKAAKVADMAITDMADNANKMGTDISSVQNAYQGFAKQNYTMLDNLKLGYGGTKSEMERLLADAEKISGIKYDLSSFSDLTEAIHVIQTEMGITGTTALEATETISGSMSGMQSAIGNLMAELGNADADIELLIGNVVEAFGHVVKNIVPIIENIVKALPPALAGILQAIGDLLPTLLSTAVDLFTQVLETILSLLPELIPAAVDAVITIAGALIDNLPLLINAAVQIIKTLAKALTEEKNLNRIIDAIVNVVLELSEALVELLPVLIKAVIKLVVGIAKGLWRNRHELLQVVKNVFNAAVSSIKTIFSWEKMKEVGKSILKGIWEGIKNMKQWIVDKVKNVGGAIIGGIKDKLKINSPSKVFEDEVGTNMGLGILSGFEKSMSKAKTKMQDAIPTDFTAEMKFKSPESKYITKDEMKQAIIEAFGQVTIEMNNREFGRAVARV